MYWFKHFSNDRNDIASKLIKKQFGAEGYGIYLSLLEVIAENVKEDKSEWGFVNPQHTLETLADECFCTVDKLKDFLLFCDEKKIFSKKNGVLYCNFMFQRLDEYSAKQFNKSRGRRAKKVSGQHRDTIGTESGIEENRIEENRIEESKDPHKSISYLQKLPQSEVTNFTSRFEISEKGVLTEAEKALNWCKSKGKVQKDYRAFFTNWLLKAQKPRTQVLKTSTPNLPTVTVDPSRFAELRKQAHSIIGRIPANNPNTTLSTTPHEINPKTYNTIGHNVVGKVGV